ncbi:hypothetical protein DRK59_07170 [Salmonella enterica subsp. diarizonae]|uniref:hypothetical protein n=1 Tax=Salmonella enterica TaxID=28901 RepID=UPI000FBBE15D|nr:hypothetical protein [Salmonella enterica]ECE0107700.1 hypothetical protein [Salmonella enterica subsp. diarizonae]EAQ6114450.1 hypothetical protein [Salmonella enterica]ECC6250496.1 hypothetical protein [Salmonella enterica]ECF6068367.1 hypothetical protein [Salmonella enterica subsp. diarizonae]
MTIYTKSPPPVAPQMPDIDPLMIAGLFGSIPAGPMEEVTNFNTALMGFTRCTYAVPNVPNSKWPWGTIWTISSKGTGPDGKRHIPAVLEPGEVTYQLFYGTDNSLYSRGGIWLTGWGNWVKRWNQS